MVGFIWGSGVEGGRKGKVGESGDGGTDESENIIWRNVSRNLELDCQQLIEHPFAPIEEHLLEGYWRDNSYTKWHLRRGRPRGWGDPRVAYRGLDRFPASLPEASGLVKLTNRGQARWWVQGDGSKMICGKVKVIYGGCRYKFSTCVDGSNMMYGKWKWDVEAADKKFSLTLDHATPGSPQPVRARSHLRAGEEKPNQPERGGSK